MNHMRPTSPLSGLRKTKIHLTLITAFLIAALFAIYSRPPALAQAPDNKQPETSGARPNTSKPSITPEPYFQVTWTAEAKTAMDVTNDQTRTVTTRHIVMAGDIIVRKLDTMPDPFGEQDNLPFNVTVTDTLDKIYTAPGYFPEKGNCNERQSWSIGDPNRYGSGDPQQALSIYPFQFGGGWLMLDPLDNTWFLEHNFYYYNTLKSTNCHAEDVSLDNSGDQDFYAIPLEHPSSADGFILSEDQDGKVYTATRHFTTIAGSFGMDYDVNWTFKARRLIDRDLTVDRLEVTQGLQDKANSIPLVQGRRTVVRAYLGVGKEQQPIDNVTGELTVYSGANLVGFVRPFNPGGRITARPSPDWLQINHTLNFEVPYPWTSMPSLRFEVEVNSDRSLFETDYFNNTLSASLISKDCTGIDIGYVPIFFTPPEGNFGWPPYPDAGMDTAQEFMRKIYPVPEKGLKYHRLPDLWWRQSIPTYEAGDVLLAALGRSGLASSSGASHIFGWLPYGGNTITLGFSTLPGFTAWGQIKSSLQDSHKLVLPHEIGHNEGLEHDLAGTSGSHWFDVYERTIKPPVSNQELLGMMRPSVDHTISAYWISPISYRLLMDKMCSGGSSTQPAEVQSAAASDNLIVTGFLNNLAVATGTLDPLYRITTAPSQIPPVGTQYCVRLKNAAGSVLNQYCFDVSFEGEGGTPAADMPYGMSVPFPVGLSRVELTKGATVLSSRQASANPPAVTLTFPNASGLTLSGVQNVTWNGSDPDGGTLTYSLLHSRDNGATWTGIASNIVGNSYAIDFSALPGGTNSLIKVIVSDGFRSAEDASDNAFTVANKPPAAAIVSPPSDTSFPVNTKITLEATGVDGEDGSLGDAAFAWSSDRDGALGTGQILEVNLSPGVHIITLTAHDNGGLLSVVTINCTSAPLASAAPTPTPTPAPLLVTVGGRVLTADSRGLKNAKVTITNSLGDTRSALTNTFGFFSLANILSGDTYTIKVSSKLYRYTPQTLQITNNITLPDFLGLE